MRGVLGVGSNLGDRERILGAAAALLEGEEGVVVEAASPLYATPALVAPGAPPGPDFLNAALRVRTTRGLHGLLDAALAVEARLGRVRHARWAARTLDVDLLWAAGGPFRSARLVVPHPALLERDFALAPLLDVLPPDVDRGPFHRALAACGGAPRRGGDARWAQGGPGCATARVQVQDRASLNRRAGQAGAEAVVLAEEPFLEAVLLRRLAG